MKLSYHASICLKEVNPSPSGGVRPWSATVFAVDERSGPEEVDSGGLESRAEGGILESSAPEMLDSGFPVILGHGGLFCLQAPGIDCVWNRSYRLIGQRGWFLSSC